MERAVSLGGSEENLPKTNDDAANAKLSCVKLGYFQDMFLPYFVKNLIRRQPLINRGYYARVSIFRRTLRKFLENGGTQILSLGAGFDTNYFLLCIEGYRDVTYYEVDFQEVVSTKAAIIQSHPKLASLLENAKITESGDLISSRYYLLVADLRDIYAFEQKLLTMNIDFNKPTLVLSECVLVYLTTSSASQVIKWTTSKFAKPLLLLYEPIKPNDPFGRVMLANMQTRGCPLKTVSAYPSLESQKERFLNLGYTHVYAVDMLHVYNNLLDPAENKRVEKLEIFDEVEEWILIQEHYCLLLAVLDKEQDSKWPSFGTLLLKQDSFNNKQDKPNVNPNKFIT